MNHQDPLTHQILSCAYKIHTALGPGLLESAYEECLAYELTKSGLKIEKQKSLPITYDSIKLDAGYRIDLLVENQIILELKSVEKLTDLHLSQILTYLRLSKLPRGLLINFNVQHLKDGIKRVSL